MQLRTNEIIKRLEQEGWYLARHGRNHDIYKHPNFIESISVPRHRTVSPGVARKIARTAGWTERR